MSQAPASAPKLVNPHLPPHLREVCALLAAGLLRLRCRTHEDMPPAVGGQGESSLHCPPDQSGHATPTRGSQA
jgi:hypothetical protein